MLRYRSSNLPIVGESNKPHTVSERSHMLTANFAFDVPVSGVVTVDMGPE